MAFPAAASSWLKVDRTELRQGAGLFILGLASLVAFLLPFEAASAREETRACEASGKWMCGLGENMYWDVLGGVTAGLYVAAALGMLLLWPWGRSPLGIDPAERARWYLGIAAVVGSAVLAGVTAALQNPSTVTFAGCAGGRDGGDCGDGTPVYWSHLPYMAPLAILVGLTGAILMWSTLPPTALRGTAGASRVAE
ncbi:MAG TPA: hypothetical protein VNZ52_01995 [Candidatus Thermoplasmatota archaeon]|nr:hypothetical protein [Candidatus Thermoplasmatota archaeon]